MIPVFKPKLDIPSILEEIKDTLESGWIGLGPKVEKLEKVLCEETGGLPVVATNSCTSALHLALRNINWVGSSWPASDYVLTSPISFVSTSSVILYENLTPVFVDVEPHTGNIDANHLEEAIKKYKPRGLIVVHLGGYPSDMDTINEICSTYGVPIIEDCAHALGATYKGSQVGWSPNLCCWSFHAVKNLPMGEGGALSCPAPSLIEELKRGRWLGIDKDTFSRSGNNKYQPDYNVRELGFKYHMSDLYACVGLVMHKHLKEDNKYRKLLADMYFLGIDLKSHPKYKTDRQSSCHFIPFFFDNPKEVVAILRENNIFPGHHYDRNDLYSLFKDAPTYPDNLPAAEWFSKHEVTLPMHCHLSLDDQYRIIELVNIVNN